MKTMTSFYQLKDKADNSPRDNLYYNLCVLNWEFKDYLIAHPDLTVNELTELVLKSSVMTKAYIADKANMPASLINSLLFDEVPEVRIAAIMNPQTSFEVFKEAVLVDKYKTNIKRRLAYSPHALKSLEVFTNLWNAKAGGELSFKLIEHLQELHKAKAKISPLIQSLIDFMNANIHTETIRTRTYYIHQHWLATAEVMDKMKDDSSSQVVESISSNPNALTSTQRSILALHGKNYTIRSNIAMNTTDNSLLNDIYNGYKGKQSRRIVQDNPYFIPLAKTVLANTDAR